MKTILVTGGNGFIGSRVVEQLLSVGYAVAILDDDSSPSKYSVRNQSKDRVTIYTKNLCDDSVYSSIKRNHDIVGIVHLAAIHYIPYCNAHPEEAVSVNVDGTKLVQQFAEEIDAPLVFASSAAVYCNEHNRQVQDIADFTLDGADVYSRTKILGEQLLAKSSLRYAALRFFNVYGAFDPHEHLIPKLIHQAQSGLEEIQLGSSDSIRDYVYVDDVAAAVVAVLLQLRSTTAEADRVLISDVATGTGTSVKDLVKELSTLYVQHEEKPYPTIIYEIPAHKRENEIKKLESISTNMSLLKRLGVEPKTSLSRGISHTLKSEVY